MAATGTCEIERIPAPSPEEFERHYLGAGRPVVITGVIDKWPAASLWTPEFLVSRFGSKQAPVSLLPEPGNYARAKMKMMAVAEYVAALSQERENARQLYMAEVPLEKFFPELMEDLQRPTFVRNEQPMKPMLYFGLGQFSQLHYHPYGSATLCQVYGHKRIWLYPPDQTRYFYKYPAYSVNHNLSLTTSPSPNPRQFPKFARAKGIEFVLGPGEMLFIPIYWWHSILNENLNLAVVFYWRRDVRSRWLPPPGLRLEYFLEMYSGLMRRARRAVGRQTGGRKNSAN